MNRVGNVITITSSEIEEALKDYILYEKEINIDKVEFLILNGKLEDAICTIPDSEEGGE